VGDGWPNYRKGNGRIEKVGNSPIDRVEKIKPDERTRTTNVVNAYSERKGLDDDETQTLLKILGLV